MDIPHEKHINSIRTGFDLEARRKYEKGQAEHGGNLWEKGAIFFAQCMREEAIDQVVYTNDLTINLQKILDIVKAAMSTDKELGITNYAYIEILQLLEGTSKDIK